MISANCSSIHTQFVRNNLDGSMAVFVVAGVNSSPAKSAKLAQSGMTYLQEQ